jgi:hypothetical protein
MKPAFQRLGVVTWLAILSIAVMVVGARNVVSAPQVSTFDTINARRINVVGADGKYSLVLADRANMPGNFFGGKEYKRPDGHRAGGMLFFNDAGDEVGGLSFSSHADGEHHSASSGLLFDQYHQDQTVGVVYQERDGKRMAGLQVWDRPDYAIQPLAEMNARAAAADTPAERKAIKEQMLAYAKAHGGVGAKRMFVGKQGGDAIVRLADKQGRPRLVMEVDAKGQPSIRFLDENGKVVRQITVAASEASGECCDIPSR